MRLKVKNIGEYLNNGDFTYLYHSDGQDTDNWCQIELDQNYNISQLQSIVIYNRDGTETQLERIKNCRIELMNSNEEIVYYTSSLTTEQSEKYIRFDGPDIVNVSNFSTTESIDYIINSTSDLYINSNHKLGSA